MRTVSSRLRVFASITLCAACAADAPQPAVHESITGAPTEIDPAPSLSIGVVEGDTLRELHRVVTPFLLPDGNLVIPVGGASTIRIFDARGEFVRSLGGRGSGPGEFADMIGAWARGDTLEAFDFRAWRITRFLPDGRVEAIHLTSGQPDLSVPLGPAGPGWMVGGVALGGPDRRDSTVVRRFDRAGADLGAVGFVYGMFRYASEQFNGPAPLSARALFAYHDGYAYLADGAAPVIHEHDADGARVRDIAWQPQPAGLSPAGAMEAVRDSAIARARPERAPALRQRFADAPVPERLPVAARLLVDAEGFFWILPYDPLRHSFAFTARVPATETWRVLSPDGADAGSVEVPAGLTITQITRDAVVGIARDSLGVESVRVHPLRRN